ncbi:hypothetical protein HUJ05_000101 [Dendroctonus ponderosae]|nr:hypothetical protein HUJ05_000101 [Dendroctonus ponderosae]
MRSKTFFFLGLAQEGDSLDFCPICGILIKFDKWAIEVSIIGHNEVLSVSLGAINGFIRLSSHVDVEVSSACNKTVSNKSISILSSWARRSILNRMATIGNIGFGLLILLVLWIITIIVFVVAIKLQSNIAWVALGLSTALTVVLLTIPTEKHVSLHVPNIVEKDYIIIYKKLILTFLVASLVVGLLTFFISYCIKPIRPKLFNSFHEN